MKKLRMLLVVATLLMVLGFALPATGASIDEGLTVCCNGPWIDSIGIY